MRALTDAESRVMAVLLAARPDRERERLHQVKIPRSTYHAVRRRAYEEGWLRDRYVPDPVPLARPHVSFFLIRPFADRSEELIRWVSSDPGTVVLWTGTQVALAVAFHSKSADARRMADRIGADRLGGIPAVTTVRADGPNIPVYFDFEGLWCHLAGIEGTLAYPHGLGGSSSSEPDGREISSLTPHQTWAARELVNRPFVAAAQGRGAHLVGPFGLPFSQRRMLLRGWVTHRTFLDPSRVPPYQGRTADQVVFVTGTPRPEARPELLFGLLTRESRVFPFLMAVGADRWLVGALGAAAGTPPSPGPARRAVLPTLREFLEGIEILQEPASGFSAPVDHRYDRLLPETNSVTPTKP
ncbi:MAG TPA: hypothetical protein VEH57_00990 [Thermoplasmata archaeon]|nr:hypothetical protein [Thermoplasmata archaeon]